MDVLIGGIRWAHIVFGFVGLAAFWVPIVTKKGGARHKTFGKVFALCAYFVAGSAMVTPPLRIGGALAAGASVTENAESFGFLIFLFYLGVVTFAFTQHAIQTVRTRRDPDSIRTRPTCWWASPPASEASSWWRGRSPSGPTSRSSCSPWRPSVCSSV